MPAGYPPAGPSLGRVVSIVRRKAESKAVGTEKAVVRGKRSEEKQCQVERARSKLFLSKHG